VAFFMGDGSSFFQKRSFNKIDGLLVFWTGGCHEHLVDRVQKAKKVKRKSENHALDTE
jgi:hypothetical protein